MSTATLRLIVSPDRKRLGAFSADLETGGALVAITRQPLVDGARELLACGFDPAALLTMRMEGKAYDSFQALPIGQWAKWTYTEGENTPLRCARWMPRPAVGDRQNSGSEPSMAPEGQERENRFHGGPPHLPQPTALLGRVA
jgi:hypothetical protein